VNISMTNNYAKPRFMFYFCISITTNSIEVSTAHIFCHFKRADLETKLKVILSILNLISLIVAAS